MDKEIEKRRQAINKLDSQLLKLLSERAARIVEIGRLKKEKGLTFYDPARERRILERLKKENPGPLNSEAVGAIFMEVISSCRFLEYPTRIAYLGPEATFTHQAALKTFGSQALFLPQKSTSSVFSAVEKSGADYGVVPVENSTEGVVSHTLDMFMDSDLKIVNEVLLPVRHHLLGFGSLKEVREVYSHPQALGQCQRWLEENLVKVTLHETESTAEAARLVSNRKGAAALASEIAATLYGLPIMVRDVQDHSRNYTRFLVIGRHFSGRTGRDRTSILFSIKDRVGALHDMLLPFQGQGLNLTKIESRPTKRRAWEYVFFVDFLGYKDDPEVREALSELEKLCLFLRVLGSYPVADEP
ncbi:MAG TPA: prephenate dehydratase [bacterium]|uniref:Bifunctional chorismate mutase/prephenate dehydratase n=1 Tax=candidate division TA06 bacterium ADurb.Bin417 TaxID=1852828 RepID=A0A1V5MKH6_UNCT6|nr:MAG: P-protein [candidate division TA06 bacterium ADurb.Bin417]HNQ34707.1 prephenate dehydratase [bacterium]HNS49188.1 prephenate dehydratase [bacterium]